MLIVLFIFKMQEQVVTLEDRVRESNVKLKQAEDSLKMESENQSQMSYRLVIVNFYYCAPNMCAIRKFILRIYHHENKPI